MADDRVGKSGTGDRGWSRGEKAALTATSLGAAGVEMRRAQKFKGGAADTVPYLLRSRRKKIVEDAARATGYGPMTVADTLKNRPLKNRAKGQLRRLGHATKLASPLLAVGAVGGGIALKRKLQGKDGVSKSLCDLQVEYVDFSKGPLQAWTGARSMGEAIRNPTAAASVAGFQGKQAMRGTRAHRAAGKIKRGVHRAEHRYGINPELVADQAKMSYKTKPWKGMGYAAQDVAEGVARLRGYA